MTNGQDDEDRFLRQAISLSMQTLEDGAGGPFGAVIVRDGQVIGEGRNRVTSALDPTAHAEVVAIRRACEAIGHFSLQGAVLYSSCEPCPMCLSAIYWARISRVVYAANQDDAAAVGFDDAFLYEQVALPTERRSLPMSRRLGEEGRQAFLRWAESPLKTPY